MSNKLTIMFINHSKEIVKALISTVKKVLKIKVYRLI
jgi:hypothetical protein